MKPFIAQHRTSHRKIIVHDKIESRDGLPTFFLVSSVGSGNLSLLSPREIGEYNFLTFNVEAHE